MTQPITDPNLIAQLEAKAKTPVGPEMSSLLDAQLLRQTKQRAVNPNPQTDAEWEALRQSHPAITPGVHNQISTAVNAFSWPFRKASEAVDEYIGEPARKSLQEDYGLSPNASSAIATGLTLPARGLLEIAGPAKAIEGVGSLVGATERALGTKLSKTNDVAFTRRQTAIENVKKSPELLQPKIASDELYKEVGKTNPIVPLKELKPVLEEIAKEERLVSNTGLSHPQTEGMANKMMSKYFTGLQKVERVPGKGVVNVTTEAAKSSAPFDEVRVVMRRLNERIGNLKSTGGEEFGDAMQVKRGFIESLDKAASHHVGAEWDKLREANQAFKQELAYEKISEVFTKNIRSLEGRPEAHAQNMSAGRTIDQIEKLIKDDPKLFDAMPKMAMDRIKIGREKLRSMPLFGAPPGVDAGSKNVWGRMLGAGTLGTVSGAAASSVLGPVGGAIVGPAVTLGTYKGSELLVRAMAKPGGIKLIEQMMTAPPGRQFTPEQMTILAGFLKASENK